jgi:hypothetical protein
MINCIITSVCSFFSLFGSYRNRYFLHVFCFSIGLFLSEVISNFGDTNFIDEPTVESSDFGTLQYFK